MGKTRCINCMQMIDETTAFCPHCGYGQKTETSPFGMKPGTILRGRYLAGRMLGQGGFGITYVGYDLTLEIKIAIKEYFPSGSVTRNSTVSNQVQWNTTQFDREQWQAGCENFLKEARRMAKLDSLPGIVRVRDTFPENQTAYIVMDFVEGETLKQKLMKTGPMKYTECLRMLRPLMESLGKMHRQGLVHRDISPDNIMVQPDGSVCLLDFGAAKDVSFQQNAASQQIAKKGFSPLEQYREKGSIGSWTDVYALCATIYYCITGKLVPDALDRLYEDELTFDVFLAEPLSEAAVNTLRDGLKLRSEERIRTVEELLGRFDGLPDSGKNMYSGSSEGTVPEKKEESESISQNQDVQQNVVYETQQNGQGAVREPQPQAYTAQTQFQDYTAQAPQPQVQGYTVQAPQTQFQGYTAQAPQPQPYSAQPQQGNAGMQYQNYSNGEQSEAQDKKKRIKKKVGIAAAVVVGLFILIGLIPDSDKEEIIQPQPDSQQADYEAAADAGQAQSSEDTGAEAAVGESLADEETVRNATSNRLMKDDSAEWIQQVWQGTVLGSETSRDSIISITFLDSLKDMPDTAWDVSQEHDGAVMAWVEQSSHEEMLDLFIGAEGGVAGNDCEGLFEGYCNVESIEFNHCFDTSQVTNMGNMFNGCENLTQLDVSGFDTSQVTNMAIMFNNCANLKSLDVGNFETGQVTDMSWMFSECYSLSELNLNSFDTSQVTNMKCMFQFCLNLAELDLSSFDTGRVTDMAAMFSTCNNLSELNISSFDTSQVTSMSYMFAYCGNLAELDLSSFDTGNVQDFEEMFKNTGFTAEGVNLKME